MCCEGCDGPHELPVEEWREEYLKLAVHAMELANAYDETRRENDRLRNSLKDVLPFALTSDDCFFRGCFMEQFCPTTMGDDGCPAYDRMLEMAIELGVDLSHVDLRA